MRERDLRRIEVLSKIVDGRTTIVSAARVLTLSTRQVRRLLERIRSGAAAIQHRARGRPSNNRICDGVRDYDLAIMRERYADFGPTLAAEKLAEHDGLTVSRETRANGCLRWPLASGYRVSSAASFISHGCAVRPLVSWCRSTAPSPAGSRLGSRRARQPDAARPPGGGAASIGDLRHGG